MRITSPLLFIATASTLPLAIKSAPTTIEPSLIHQCGTSEMYCQDYQTCCLYSLTSIPPDKAGHSQTLEWGCCPYTNGVCCPANNSCCPVSRYIV
ncbi:hypothetical protein T439DRAFT_80033 [Meredithblackwellia eburnea MCA 4105]